MGQNNLAGLEGITATFFTPLGPQTVPIEEFRLPDKDPYDRFVENLGISLELPGDTDVFPVEDLPPRVHGKELPYLPSHGAGHTPKWAR